MRSDLSPVIRLREWKTERGTDCVSLLNRWFTHFAAFNVSSPIEKSFFPPSCLIPPTLFTSTSLLSLTTHRFFSKSLFISRGKKTKQWVSWINFLLYSLFPISLLLSSLYHFTQLFPICPGFPAVHLVKEQTANQDDTDPCFVFFPSFVFVFHLHPALALLLFHVISIFSCYFLTWQFHLAISLSRVTALPPLSWKLLLPACRGRRKGVQKNEGEEL